MLGDCGANALGALLGLRLASIPGRAPGPALLAGVVGADPGQREGQLHQGHRGHAGTARTGPARPPPVVSARRTTVARGVAGRRGADRGAHRCSPGSPASAAPWCSPTPSAPTAPATPTWPRTPCPNIVFEVVAGGALASLVVPMLAGGIAAGDREQVRRTASALLGWTLLILTPLAVAGRAARRADRRGCCSAVRQRPGQGRPGRPVPASSSPRRSCSTASASCSPACCRRTAGSPARRSRRCCPASSSPAAYLVFAAHRRQPGRRGACRRRPSWCGGAILDGRGALTRSALLAVRAGSASGARCCGNRSRASWRGSPVGVSTWGRCRSPGPGRGARPRCLVGRRPRRWRTCDPMSEPCCSAGARPRPSPR